MRSAPADNADRDLLAQPFASWVEHGQLPAQMSALCDVANTLVSLVMTAHDNPNVVPEIAQLAPRIRRSAETRRVQAFDNVTCMTSGVSIPPQD